MYGIEYFIEKIDSNHLLALVDVGAMGGIPLKWKMLLPVMQIIAFEPDYREFYKLKDSDNIRNFNYALYSKSIDLVYYISKEEGKSSILKPNLDFLSQYENKERFSIVKEEQIPSGRVKTLDSIIKDGLIRDIDFIKLDTQGSELYILQGGEEKAIPKIFGAQIEVEFVEMYQNQPLFRDIDGFMTRYGFQLIDLRRTFFKRKDYYDYIGRGELIFADALYFKKIESFFQELKEVKDKSYAKSKIFKGILICMIYKLFDYAVAIAKMGLQDNYLTGFEYQNSISNIKRCSLKGIPMRFHLNISFYNIIDTILEKLKPQSLLGWGDSDRYIANIKDK